MEGWEMRAFEINPRTITKVGLPNLNKLTDYGGSLAVVFSQYGPVDLTKATMFFSAPEEYLRSQINSYGAKLSYKVIFGGGYEKTMYTSIILHISHFPPAVLWTMKFKLPTC